MQAGLLGPLQYLNGAVEGRQQRTTTDKVLAQMKKTPVNDFFAKGGFIRAPTAAWCTTCT